VLQLLWRFVILGLLATFIMMIMMIMMMVSALVSRICKMRTCVEGGEEEMKLAKVGMGIEGAREWLCGVDQLVG
jgi:hypothetical protein